jgi:hypothetical protein
MSIQAIIQGRSDDLLHITIGERTYEFNVNLPTKDDYISIDFGSDKEVTVWYNGCWRARPSGFAKEDTKYIFVAQHADDIDYSVILSVEIEEPSFSVYETAYGQTREVYE